MGKGKKPSRKNDMKKANSLQDRYLEHQEKLRQEPTSLAIEHWKKEKQQFLVRIRFYYSRAKVKENGIIDGLLKDA